MMKNLHWNNLIDCAIWNMMYFQEPWYLEGTFVQKQQMGRQLKIEKLDMKKVAKVPQFDPKYSTIL